MFLHDELMRARQGDLLREAAHIRLAAPILVRPGAGRPEGRAL